MAPQTWDITYYAIGGSGDNTSSASDTGLANVQNWPFDYASTIVPASGSGNTISSDGNVGANLQTWDFLYWDGFTHGVGSGNTNSAGGGDAVVASYIFYTISATVSASGSGDNASAGVGNATGSSAPTPISAGGFGNTTSSGVGRTFYASLIRDAYVTINDPTTSLSVNQTSTYVELNNPASSVNVELETEVPS